MRTLSQCNIDDARKILANFLSARNCLFRDDARGIFVIDEFGSDYVQVILYFNTPIANFVVFYEFYCSICDVEEHIGFFRGFML